MTSLPDDALVVRGGENLASSFAGAAGITFDATGKLDDVSVNSAVGLSVSELTQPNRRLKYRGIPHRQVGVQQWEPYERQAVMSSHHQLCLTRIMRS